MTAIDFNGPRFHVDKPHSPQTNNSNKQTVVKSEFESKLAWWLCFPHAQQVNKKRFSGRIKTLDQTPRQKKEAKKERGTNWNEIEKALKITKLSFDDP